MKEIVELFDNMPDYQLEDCLAELAGWRKTGSLVLDGTFGKYVEEVRKKSQKKMFELSLMTTEKLVVEQAANRYLALKILEKDRAEKNERLNMLLNLAGKMAMAANNVFNARLFDLSDSIRGLKDKVDDYNNEIFSKLDP